MKIYCCGIAGTGMSALAGLMVQKGFDVMGSDTSFYPPVGDILKNMNVKTFTGFKGENIPGDIDCCIIGNIISRGNPEAEYILNRRIDYLSMAEALYRFFLKDRTGIIVAGTHGKTTITSFVSHMLHAAGLDPGYFIGGKPVNLPANYAIGTGEYFVVEGDEYETSFFDRSSKFLKYHPNHLILTSLEYDHIDFFPTEDLYLKSFKNLVNQVPQNGIIISNGGSPMNEMAVADSFSPVLSYGHQGSHCPIGNIVSIPEGYDFSVKIGDREYHFRTRLKGRYNVWNLTAGIILGHHLEIPMAEIQKAVKSFRGVERRLRYLGRMGEILFYEDFAHHPTSIGYLLRDIRELSGDRHVKAFFEPRSWSLRRNIFQDRLTESLGYADSLVIKDIYQKDKIPPEDRLNVDQIRSDLRKLGKTVDICSEAGDILEIIRQMDHSSGQVAVFISNGDFGGVISSVKEMLES
jgi:UDP-N-acetylmuramate: L-alanyl-gamma-D-glutamyl-meso-diaminopimelate ligase